MKKLMALVGAVLVAGVVIVGRASTFSAETDGNTLLDTVVNDMATKQTQYVKDNGTYWQGLETHEPSEATKESKLNAKPHDVSKTWNDMGIPVPATSKFSFRTDVYDGPKGKGYFVTIRTVENGDMYEKVVNVGPETYHAHDWAYVPPK